MTLLPLFLKLDGRPGLLVGAGTVALWAGAAAVTLYLRFLFPGAPDVHRAEINLVVLSTYLIVFLVIGAVAIALTANSGGTCTSRSRIPVGTGRNSLA